MGDTKVRIDSDLYNSVKAIAEKTGKSISDIVEEAVRAYLIGAESSTESKPIKSIMTRIITTHFAGKCLRCRSDIPQGELAYYVRIVYSDNTVKSYLLCLDCYYKDTALAQQYLKKRKLEIIIRGLQKRAEELANEVERLQAQVELSKIKSELATLFNNFKSVILDPNSDYASKFLQIIEGINQLVDSINKLEYTIKEVAKPTTKKHGIIKAAKGV